VRLIQQGKNLLTYGISYLPVNTTNIINHTLYPNSFNTFRWRFCRRSYNAPRRGGLSRCSFCRHLRMVSGDVSFPDSNRAKKLNRFDSCLQISEQRRLSLSLVAGCFSNNPCTISFVRFIVVWLTYINTLLYIGWIPFVVLSLSTFAWNLHEEWQLPTLVLVYPFSL
jgi:hypothetical protein